jgi:hypothetical protein
MDGIGNRMIEFCCDFGVKLSPLQYQQTIIIIKKEWDSMVLMMSNDSLPLKYTTFHYLFYVARWSPP